MENRRTSTVRRVVVNGRELSPEEIAALPRGVFDDPGGDPDAAFEALAGLAEPRRVSRITSRVVDGSADFEIGIPGHAANRDDARRALRRTWALALGAACASAVSAGVLAALWWPLGATALIAFLVLSGYAAWSVNLSGWRGNPDARRHIGSRERLRLGFIQTLAVVASIGVSLVLTAWVLGAWAWAGDRFETQLEALIGKPLGED